ncbi:hypothetical protein KIPB_005870 [Kipferlia bialata]|uniref:Uncharacterized protein n=1 Tax=Kipferlia bialata TaxID=797122 RepID=A0A9K3GIT5_9EUKA|nr:hypothetical protein KIPB_005870 [Kipferlia bialata]|eukprot:g5870.t1
MCEDSQACHVLGTKMDLVAGPAPRCAQVHALTLLRARSAFQGRAMPVDASLTSAPGHSVTRTLAHAFLNVFHRHDVSTHYAAAVTALPPSALATSLLGLGALALRCNDLFSTDLVSLSVPVPLDAVVGGTQLPDTYLRQVGPLVAGVIARSAVLVLSHLDECLTRAQKAEADRERERIRERDRKGEPSTDAAEPVSPVACCMLALSVVFGALVGETSAETGMTETACSPLPPSPCHPSALVCAMPDPCGVMPAFMQWLSESLSGVAGQALEGGAMGSYAHAALTLLGSIGGDRFSGCVSQGLSLAKTIVSERDRDTDAHAQPMNPRDRLSRVHTSTVSAEQSTEAEARRQMLVVAALRILDTHSPDTALHCVRAITQSPGPKGVAPPVVAEILRIVAHSMERGVSTSVSIAHEMGLLQMNNGNNSAPKSTYGGGVPSAPVPSGLPPPTTLFSMVVSALHTPCSGHSGVTQIGVAGRLVAAYARLFQQRSASPLSVSLQTVKGAEQPLWHLMLAVCHAVVSLSRAPTPYPHLRDMALAQCLTGLYYCTAAPSLQCSDAAPSLVPAGEAMLARMASGSDVTHTLSRLVADALSAGVGGWLPVSAKPLPSLRTVVSLALRCLLRMVTVQRDRAGDAVVAGDVCRLLVALGVALPVDKRALGSVPVTAHEAMPVCLLLATSVGDGAECGWGEGEAEAEAEAAGVVSEGIASTAGQLLVHIAKSTRLSLRLTNSQCLHSILLSLSAALVSAPLAKPVIRTLSRLPTPLLLLLVLGQPSVSQTEVDVETTLLPQIAALASITTPDLAGVDNTVGARLEGVAEMALHTLFRAVKPALETGSPAAGGEKALFILGYIRTSSVLRLLGPYFAMLHAARISRVPVSTSVWRSLGYLLRIYAVWIHATALTKGDSSPSVSSDDTDQAVADVLCALIGSHAVAHLYPYTLGDRPSDTVEYDTMQQSWSGQQEPGVELAAVPAVMREMVYAFAHSGSPSHTSSLALALSQAPLSHKTLLTSMLSVGDSGIEQVNMATLARHLSNRPRPEGEAEQQAQKKEADALTNCAVSYNTLTRERQSVTSCVEGWSWLVSAVSIVCDAAATRLSPNSTTATLASATVSYLGCTQCLEAALSLSALSPDASTECGKTALLCANAAGTSAAALGASLPASAVERAVAAGLRATEGNTKDRDTDALNRNAAAAVSVLLAIDHPCLSSAVDTALQGSSLVSRLFRAASRPGTDATVYVATLSSLLQVRNAVTGTAFPAVLVADLIASLSLSPSSVGESGMPLSDACALEFVRARAVLSLVLSLSCLNKGIAALCAEPLISVLRGPGGELARHPALPSDPAYQADYARLAVNGAVLPGADYVHPGQSDAICLASVPVLAHLSLYCTVLQCLLAMDRDEGSVLVREYVSSIHQSLVTLIESRPEAGPGRTPSALLATCLVLQAQTLAIRLIGSEDNTPAPTKGQGAQGAQGQEKERCLFCRVMRSSGTLLESLAPEEVSRGPSALDTTLSLSQAPVFDGSLSLLTAGALGASRANPSDTLTMSSVGGGVATTTLGETTDKAAPSLPPSHPLARGTAACIAVLTGPADVTEESLHAAIAFATSALRFLSTPSAAYAVETALLVVHSVLEPRCTAERERVNKSSDAYACAFERGVLPVPEALVTAVNAVFHSVKQVCDGPSGAVCPQAQDLLSLARQTEDLLRP